MTKDGNAENFEFVIDLKSTTSHSAALQLNFLSIEPEKGFFVAP